ncbi:hypothetical protein NMG60_11030997 [Bertholletia excelsa]
MESSESADSSFKTRVQKIFGSLSSSHSPWSLTDDEVEKREWRRDGSATGRDDDQTPCSSSFDGVFEKHRKKRINIRREYEDDLDDLDDDDQLGGGSARKDGEGSDEWEIRSSIGLDSTLDNEEEEDEFDKVAVGREGAGDRLYMGHVSDHGRFLNSHNVLPNSVFGATKDPRANHLAASRRLKEDEAEAQQYGSNHASDESISSIVKPPVRASEDSDKPKSVLKRKDETMVSNVKKRVRFDPDCKDGDKASGKTQDHLKQFSNYNSLLDRTTQGVPDYLLNPSKYTCYSLDSASDMDDELNRKACMDFLKMEKISKPNETSSQSAEASSDLPKSITFIPRKKGGSTRTMNDGSDVKQDQEDGNAGKLFAQRGFPVSIAAAEGRKWS